MTLGVIGSPLFCKACVSRKVWRLLAVDREVIDVAGAGGTSRALGGRVLHCQEERDREVWERTRGSCNVSHLARGQRYAMG